MPKFLKKLLPVLFIASFVSVFSIGTNVLVKQSNNSTKYSLINKNDSNKINSDPLKIESDYSKTQLNNSSFFTFNDSKDTITGLTDLGKKQKTLSIPENVKIIGESVFDWNKVIKNVILAPNIEKIDKLAFRGCINLKRINLFVTHLKEIGDYAFQGCSSLTFVNFPSSIEKIGSYAFSNTTNLRNVYLQANSNIQYSNNVFDNSGLESIVLPDSMTTIPESFLEDCKILKTVTFPKNLKKIGPSAFLNCNSLILKFTKDMKIESFGGDSKTYKGVKRILVDSQELVDKLIVSGAERNSIAISNNDLYVIVNEKMVALTDLGKTKDTITIPNNINSIEDDAFLDHSPNLSKVIIYSEKLILQNNALKSLSDNVQYDVYNQDVKDVLIQHNVKHDKINLLVSKEELAKQSFNYSLLGIVLGSIIASIILLGLAIGLPLKKMHRKTNLLHKNTREMFIHTNKKIDNLTVSIGAVFKKLSNNSIKKRPTMLKASKPTNPNVKKVAPPTNLKHNTQVQAPINNEPKQPSSFKNTQKPINVNK
ncbi:leucine-rich repeat domain-containing protein [Mycoplasmoides pirum]|uniref:leucine-rich repeat domain-containing protein n=1 Tax=Mycoplasmoides pirum TaxID=2122 RepID=UPI00048161ED|nr:leucine-rich repeat domain-containing protein [Mycoplasmoides pirum]